jgi:hypothetical protein
MSYLNRGGIRCKIPVISYVYHTAGLALLTQHGIKPQQLTELRFIIWCG